MIAVMHLRVACTPAAGDDAVGVEGFSDRRKWTTSTGKEFPDEAICGWIDQKTISVVLEKR